MDKSKIPYIAIIFILLFYIGFSNNKLRFMYDDHIGEYDIASQMIIIDATAGNYLDTALHEYAHHVWNNFDYKTQRSYKPYIENQYIPEGYDEFDYSEKFARQIEKSCRLRNEGLNDTTRISKYPNYDDILEFYFNRACDKIEVKNMHKLKTKIVLH